VEHGATRQKGSKQMTREEALNTARNTYETAFADDAGKAFDAYQADIRRINKEYQQ